MKRSLILALGLAALSAASFAAEAVPLQLSLDFSARPSASIAAPLPLSMPSAVESALKAGDPHAFYGAALAAEYAIPAGDDHQARLFAEGAQRAEADRIMAARASDAPAEPLAARVARRTKLDYDEFARLVGEAPRLSLGAFQDTEAKRELLARSGYTHLIGPGGRRIPLESADQARIGRAFARTLETLRRRGQRGASPK